MHNPGSARAYFPAAPTGFDAQFFDVTKRPCIEYFRQGTKTVFRFIMAIVQEIFVLVHVLN